MKRNPESRSWREKIPQQDTAPAEETAIPHPRVEDWGVTAEEASALLRRQMCPVCGEGPWKSPLNHASRKHAIDRFTMRDICGLTTNDTVVDPELRERFSERGKGIDMSKVNHKGKPRKKQRWTEAGRERNKQTLAEWEKANPEEALAQRRRIAADRSPERSARQSEAQRQWWADHPEAKEEARKRIAESIPLEDRSRLISEAWERRGLKTCGTRAAYRRGCRCEECRGAYLAYRKEHG